MRSLILLLCVLISAVILPGSAIAQWSDDFDSYENGSGLIGQGGWEGWNLQQHSDAHVTNVQSLSLPHSVEITPNTDVVQQFEGVTSGQWVITAWQYIPSTAGGDQFFILLNTYSFNGPFNWSLQIHFADGWVTDLNTSDQLPLIPDQWVEIRVEIDLNADIQTVSYGGDVLVQKSWTDGATGDGALDIACINLFGVSGDGIYYDDISLGDEVVAVQDEVAPIVGFESIRPNPFRTETTIVFSMEDADHVEATIYDVAGRPTRTLVSRSFPAGRHSVQWDGRDEIGHRVASGVYFLEVRDRSRTMTRKLVMLE